jgi:hypothetical protein
MKGVAKRKELREVDQIIEHVSAARSVLLGVETAAICAASCNRFIYWVLFSDN